MWMTIKDTNISKHAYITYMLPLVVSTVTDEAPPPPTHIFQAPMWPCNCKVFLFFSLGLTNAPNTEIFLYLSIVHNFQNTHISACRNSDGVLQTHSVVLLQSAKEIRKKMTVTVTIWKLAEGKELWVYAVLTRLNSRTSVKDKNCVFCTCPTTLFH